MSDLQILAVAPHLCGFTEAVARRRLLLPFTVFCDESGKSELPIFVMAGFMARAEDWAKFNNEWQVILNEEPAVRSFHMAEARRLGYYSKLPRLIEVIKRHVIMGFAVTVRHDDYRKVFRGKIARRMDNPYVFMFNSIIGLAAFWQIEQNLNERMDFIFDEQLDQSDYIQSVYSEIMAQTSDDVKERLGGRPIHLKDDDTPPLQAADILAWSIRRVSYLAENHEQVDDDLRSLFEGLPLIKQHFSERHLSGVIAGINRINREREMITEHQFYNALPVRDLLLMTVNKEMMLRAREGDTIPLMSFPAKQTKRFLLVHSCPLCGNPHLHKRVGDVCLAAV